MSKRENVKFIARRTCTVVNDDEAERVSEPFNTPLESFTDTPAYVLIGEPGAGKTTVFKSEAEKQGSVYVTVRRFLKYDEQQWRGKTLYLDGLDESRVGTVDGRTPLDRICANLDQLGRPTFRLSCRWADWFGANDKEHLKDVSSNGTVTVIRLDPLSKDDIREILIRDHGVADPDGFIDSARALGIHSLLENPQNLDMLAKSVAHGAWPSSRKEAFEQACRILASEANGEHRVANHLSNDIDNLVNVAGRLCAVQLLTGSAGYTLPGRALPDADYPSLAELGGVAESPVRTALGTRLFIGTSEGRLAPAHRQVAEFLAARHVSNLVDNGLRVERFLALIKSFDGELVPAFRNFVSWLAVHNRRSRKRLSELNPSGLIYQGDEETYSVGEKQDILRQLRREADWNPWCLRSISRTSGIGKIVSPDLEGTFRDILSSSERDQCHQSYVLMIMDILADGKPLRALSPVLINIIYDSTWKPGVRCGALDVLVAYHNTGCLESDVLLTILADVTTGEIDDPVDELLGILLKSLYPRVLRTTDIMQLLRRPKDVSRTGEYVEFWIRHLPSNSTPDQIADVLDRIASRFDNYRPFMVGEADLYTTMGQLPLILLNQLIDESMDKLPKGRPVIIEGDIDVSVHDPHFFGGPLDAITVERVPRARAPLNDISAERLFDWLLVASDPKIRAPESLTLGLRMGLQWNEGKLKELTAHGVDRCLASGDAWSCMGLVDRHLFGARPFNYGSWCLEKAVEADDERAAIFYLGEVLTCVGDQWKAGGLTVDEVRKALGAKASLLVLFDQGIQQKDVRARQIVLAGKHESRNDSEHQLAWQREIEDHAQELVAGRSEPRLLHRIAKVYFGISEGAQGTTPAERLANLVGSRADLVVVLREGLETVLNRPDLPDYRRAGLLFDSEEPGHLALPLIAGLDSLERSGVLVVEELGEERVRLAVAVLYTVQYSISEITNEQELYRPKWFQAALRNKPVLVADVLRRCVEDKLRAGKQAEIELYQLAADDGHAEVARLASLPLLELFPNAATVESRRQLGRLLKAALNNCQRSQVRDVVKRRLEKGDLVSGQQVYWLAAGYFLMPDSCRAGIQNLMTKSDAAFRGVWEFFADGRIPMKLARQFAAADFEFLIVLVASAIERHGMTKGVWWTVSNLLGELASNPLPEVLETLERLSGLSALGPWVPAISEVRHRHLRRRREHEFQHCDVRQATKTLANEDPANAADLAAVLVDVLEDLSKRIRDGSTSDWRQYWNANSPHQTGNPKPETWCRDSLLSDLQVRLSLLGIDAQKEGAYAGEKRSDIRVSYGGLNIPVEIKKSCHRDLWTAVKGQLIAKYSKDPGVNGYGVYIVFWFGDTDRCRPTRLSGWTPPNAAALKLKITEMLSDQERRMISVCVIDVSQPAG